MSLVVVRNDRSKRVLSLQRESESGTCPTCADTTITSRPCPSPRHSFSFPLPPHHDLKMSTWHIFKTHWPSQHGHREVDLGPARGPTRPRSCPRYLKSPISRPGSPGASAQHSQKAQYPPQQIMYLAIQRIYTLTATLFGGTNESDSKEHQQ